MLEQLKKGDEAAFKQLVETSKDLVYRTTLGIVQHPEEAEDLAQEVFMYVWQSIGSFRGEAKISTWLYKIAISRAMNWEQKKRAKKRFSSVSAFFRTGGEEVPGFHHPGVALDRKEDAALLFKAINRLPQNQRIAFLLVKTEGLSHEEAGKVMDVSPKAIDSLLQRAKENLRKYLGGHFRKG